MSVTVAGVRMGSPAWRAGIRAGETLSRIDGHDIEDVLDYRFYMTARSLTLLLIDSSGIPRAVNIRKGEYEDLGLEFDSYLMDSHRRCGNNCVFCFIDQLPAGLRDSLYFKDDDARLSFLFGNYITLTNLRERDVERILEMRLSPVNISVHTMNPELRVRMMGNARAGKVLEYLPRLAAGGIMLNVQLVLCPGYNDGEELEFSLRELLKLSPAVQSIAAVPVGLTAHRTHLTALRPFSTDEARSVLDVLERFARESMSRHGRYICHGADEFYLLAGLDFPDCDRYDDFDQLENGVGMSALLRDGFFEALEELDSGATIRRERCVTIATGFAAYDLMSDFAAALSERFRGVSIHVVAVRNDFFGQDVTVSGLITGADLISALRGKNLGDALLISRSMLRREGDLMLDGVGVQDLCAAFGVPVIPVENDADALIRAVLGSAI